MGIDLIHDRTKYHPASSGASREAHSCCIKKVRTTTDVIRHRQIHFAPVFSAPITFAPVLLLFTEGTDVVQQMDVGLEEKQEEKKRPEPSTSEIIDSVSA